MTGASRSVSVLMAVHNGGAYLGEAVESILRQTFSEFEFLIVDDGSEDGSAISLDAFAGRDRRVRVVHRPNEGLAASLNVGLALAVGDIIVRMDADDVAAPGRIARQRAFLAEHPRVAAVGSAIRYIDQNGRHLGVGNYPLSPPEVAAKLHQGHSPMAHPAVAMRREAVASVGGYRPLYRYAEDFDLWQRLSDRYELANMPDVLLDYRVHGQNASRVHHFEQALSGYVARFAAQERRKGRLDPTVGLTELALGDLDRFDLEPHDRAAILTYLSEAALSSYKATGNRRHLAEAEKGFFALGPAANHRGRRIAIRLAHALLSVGEVRRGASALGASVQVHTLRFGGVGLVRRLSSWPRNAVRNREIRKWLVHCADPHGPQIPPPHTVLSPQLLQELVCEAEAHAVLPAVIRNLPEYVQGSEYADARKDALSRRLVMFGLSAMLRHHGDALLAGMSDLAVAIVKGRTFARAIYPDPALRTFTDIDLLVAPSAVSQVGTVLQAQGFKFVEYDHDPERLEAKWVHTSNPVLLVEVHTNLVHHPGLRKVMSLTLDDLGGNADSPAALLTIACMHGGLHQFERLQQVVDICQAARALTTMEEEQRFVALVTRVGGRLAAVAGLELATRLFAEPRCREIARALGPERYAGLSRLLISSTVVASTKNAERSLYSWRRKAFRDLLKRGHRRQSLPDSTAVP